MYGETLLGVMGILMIVTIVWALIQSKTNPVPIFVIVPIVAAVIVGFGPHEIFAFVKAGVSKTWSTAVLFIFSIVFFALMGDKKIKKKKSNMWKEETREKKRAKKRGRKEDKD